MITGSCLCEAIKYEIQGSISAIWCCHCSKCRKASGSAFMPGASCRAKYFRWIQSEDSMSEYRSPSGYRKRFCSHCGSPIPVMGENHVYIPAGTLIGDPETEVAHHIHTQSKASWFHIADGQTQFDVGPDASRHPRSPK